MNRKLVKEFVESRGIVAVKADYTNESEEIAQLMTELGNAGTVLPFYAIYPRGGGKPVTFGGVITQGQVLNLLKEATERPSNKVAGLPR